MTLLNYLLEANLSLIFFLIFYLLFLFRETNFTLSRAYLLLAILVSVASPMIHVGSTSLTAVLPSVSNVLPSYWLPEVVVGKEDYVSSTTPSIGIWQYVKVIYITGAGLYFLYFILRLLRILRFLKSTRSRSLNNYKIIESNENTAPFSFFNYIFIGNCQNLSETDKKQILDHELVHVKQWHSADIVILQVLHGFFWFNPFILLYKKIFVQLHEFEADARSVESQDVNKYCNLLARVALHSAGFSLGNHFNNSLTIKRIQMMRTIKNKIHRWKVATLLLVVSSVVVLIACQEQLTSELQQPNTEKTLLPPDVAADLEVFRKQYPEDNIAYMEENRLVVMNKATHPGVSENSAEITYITLKQYPAKYGTLFRVKRGGNADQLQRGNADQLQRDNADRSQSVFMVVEHQPEYKGGYEAMMDILKENIQYPKEARDKGIKGTSYVSFIVEVDGTISDVKLLSGFDPSCDEEALRVVKMLDEWNPGKQNEKSVRVRFTLPIKFNL